MIVIAIDSDSIDNDSAHCNGDSVNEESND